MPGVDKSGLEITVDNGGLAMSETDLPREILVNQYNDFRRFYELEPAFHNHCRLNAIGELGADGFDLRLRLGMRPGPFKIGPELRLLSRRRALNSWARSPFCWTP
jgi:hypothetical protein